MIVHIYIYLYLFIYIYVHIHNQYSYVKQYAGACLRKDNLPFESNGS